MAALSMSKRNQASSRNFGLFCPAQQAPFPDQKDRLEPPCSGGDPRWGRSGYGISRPPPFSIAFPELGNERPQQVGKFITPGIFAGRRCLQIPVLQQTE